ncbi:starch synthase [Clostridium tetanomorphum]|uniref:glycogen synthase GlgA n=1 Tax=Clostridium tetanomorphum TaxID=1553 RepID=UPI0004498884|nr:glycogen synthase GlgA [Clostridium tetanomorphum]KAJ53838.1 glycogen synthase [Clostridium tetanomorphum DSM 665]MBP1862572.1 starch synthase [Clostridium tetanomorphum]NRS85587.1 starch synthase [Clostridium tetanomorphum]
MKVLFVASEVDPFMKTGGLADVAYALPKALRKLGIDIRVMMPNYESIPQKYKDRMSKISSFSIPVGWRNQYGGLLYLEEDGIPFYFLDNEYYFKRSDGAYGYYDDGERFVYFSRGVVESIKFMGDFKPDIVHCNDWHTAIIPLLIKEQYKGNHIFSNIKTLFTIHNLQYQGIFNKEILVELLGLGDNYFSESSLKYYDKISFMKGGIIYSDIVTTVSKTYSEEIRTQNYGEGLHGLLNEISYKLYGIINGIDYDLFNPRYDKDLYFNFDENNIEDKWKNKLELQKSLGLSVDMNIPMIGIVSRLASQKGMDLICYVMEEIMKLNVQLVVLGTGENKFEEAFRYYAQIYPQKVSSNIFFSNELAKKIYGSSDMFLMPSQFEPCGIGQLIAMRYGSLPIVRETGGLKDTVNSYNEFSGEGNGFSFTNYNAHDMLYTIKRALNFYYNKGVWNNLMINSMKIDNSWNKSANEYIQIYDKLLWDM